MAYRGMGKISVTVQILEDGRYLETSHEAPSVGRSYYLFDAEEYTAPQRKLFESLVDEWHKSGKHNGSIDRYEFREQVKIKYGEGYDRLRYADGNKIHVVKSTQEIPEHVLLDFYDGNRQRVLGVVKSTTRYTKNQFTRMIDNTINAMIEHEVDTLRFQDIMKTINDFNEAEK